MDEIRCLDHGYLKRIESWGSDERIVEAARMSTDKGFLGWGGPCVVCDGTAIDNTLAVPQPCTRCKGTGKIAGDEKLLAYLYSNHHDTPFEMAGMIIEVQAPIFVFREWHQHRTQSYNELSARYTPLPDLNYIPTVERLLINSKTNKQAGTINGAADLTPEDAAEYQTMLRDAYAKDEHVYRTALQMGVPKELARIHLPVGRYSRMRASANLRNWLAFLTLRQSPNAQYEIRVFADAVSHYISEAFPRTYALFAGGR